MTDTTEQGSAGYDFVLKFYNKEPILSSVIATIITITPLAIAFLYYLNRRAENQTANLKNIREHEFKMKKEGLK